MYVHAVTAGLIVQEAESDWSSEVPQWWDVPGLSGPHWEAQPAKNVFVPGKGTVSYALSSCAYTVFKVDEFLQKGAGPNHGVFYKPVQGHDTVSYSPN